MSGEPKTGTRQDGGTGPDRRASMSSSLKCFRALELLASPPYELSLTDIAVELSLPVTSAHRIVTTLCVAGAAEQDTKTKWYRLTGHTLWIGTSYLRRCPVYRAAFVILQEMAHKCCSLGLNQSLTYLGTIDNDQVLYLHSVGNPAALSLFANTGERRPMHSTALGKETTPCFPTPRSQEPRSRGEADQNRPPDNDHGATPSGRNSPSSGIAAMPSMMRRNARGTRCVASAYPRSLGLCHRSHEHQRSRLFVWGCADRVFRSSRPRRGAPGVCSDWLRVANQSH